MRACVLYIYISHDDFVVCANYSACFRGVHTWLAILVVLLLLTARKVPILGVTIRNT